VIRGHFSRPIQALLLSIGLNRANMAPKGKAKKSGATSCSVDEQRIRDLERSVLESAANANNIVDLIEFCGSDEPKTVHSASQALQRVFIHFIETGELAQLKAKKAKVNVLELAYSSIGSDVVLSSGLCASGVKSGSCP
jgi:hypothetical protein